MNTDTKYLDLLRVMDNREFKMYRVSRMMADEHITEEEIAKEWFNTDSGKLAVREFVENMARQFYFTLTPYNNSISIHCGEQSIIHYWNEIGRVDSNYCVGCESKDSAYLQAAMWLVEQQMKGEKDEVVWDDCAS